MKRFFRTKSRRKVFGVCEGLSLYTNTDPIIWRLLFFGLIFTPFPIITTYLLLTILTESI
jgi:phage shock protein PspC (stress-responsive transcriptional regulator)